MRQSTLAMQIKCTRFNYNCVLTEELGIINDVLLVKSSAEYITYSLAFHFYSPNVQSSLLHTWHCASTTEINILYFKYHVYVYSKATRLSIANNKSVYTNLHIFIRLADHVGFVHSTRPI